MTWEGMQKFPFLRSVYGELTKSERRIADYIAAHAETVMEQTIADIAGQTDSSEITVSRFCKKVGCTGLQEVKLQVAAGLSTAAHDTYHDIHGDDSTYTVMWKIFKNLTEGLQDTAGLISGGRGSGGFHFVRSRAGGSVRIRQFGYCMSGYCDAIHALGTLDSSV